MNVCSQIEQQLSLSVCWCQGEPDVCSELTLVMVVWRHAACEGSTGSTLCEVYFTHPQKREGRCCLEIS